MTLDENASSRFSTLRLMIGAVLLALISYNSGVQRARAEKSVSEYQQMTVQYQRSINEYSRMREEYARIEAKCADLQSQYTALKAEYDQISKARKVNRK